jgi:hypothetical protein
MSLPLSITNLFSETYDGFTAARFKSSSEAHNVETALKEAQQSYRTKIHKTKKRGREFIVMLVEQT